jgi:hypothetical protein
MGRVDRRGAELDSDRLRIRGAFQARAVCWVCFRASIVALWNAFWYAVDRALKRRTE